MLGKLINGFWTLFAFPFRAFAAITLAIESEVFGCFKEVRFSDPDYELAEVLNDKDFGQLVVVWDSFGKEDKILKALKAYNEKTPTPDPGWLHHKMEALKTWAYSVIRQYE